MAEEEVKKTQEAPAEEAETEQNENYAKSGKRSKKHEEETRAEEERLAKAAEHKAAVAAGEKPKGAAPKTRPVAERKGKKYREAYKKVEQGKAYPLAEALRLAKETSYTKFPATVEIHARLGVDPRHADQNVRSTVVLPNGNGKTVRVAGFAPLDQAKAAKAAGADIAEDDEFLRRLEKNEIDFDVLISTPQFMPKLGKFARFLGPKGLMPNPKAGTVTADVEKAVKEAKAGKVEYRVDSEAIVHIGIGKTDFEDGKLEENAKVFFESLKNQKPATIKGQYVKSVYVSTTMGPSILVENIYN